MLYPEDLADLNIFTPVNYQGYLNFTLTAVSLENDGDSTNTRSEVFTVNFNFDPLAVDDGRIPQEPILIVPNLTISNDTVTGDNVGNEDESVVLSLTASQGAGETLDPVVVTVIISDVPANFQVIGAVYDPVNDEYVANADDFASGNIRVIPPGDFSGFFDLTVEAVATASNGRSSTSGEQTLTSYVDPVADGFSISVGPTSSLEDANITFGVSFGSLDAFNSEILYSGIYTFGGNSEWFYVDIDDPLIATILGGYSFVLPGDADAFAFGFDLTGYYRIPFSVSSFIIDVLDNWHGTITGSIRVPVIELNDDFDGDNFILSGR